MLIDISGLTESKPLNIDMDFELNDVAFLKDYNIVKSNPIKIFGKIYKRSKEIWFEGKYIFTGTFLCNRCLDKVDRTYEAEFEYQLNEENCPYLDEYMLDLTGLLIEELTFSVPMKTVCEEDCQGLCKSCGANLNKDECDCDQDDIDPRLASLKNFFSSNEEV